MRRGEARLFWLKPEEAERMIAAGRARAQRLEEEIESKVAAQPVKIRAMIRAAAVRDAKTARRFVALCMFLLGTGCRLSEALRVKPTDVDLGQSFAFCGKTKNGKPRPVHLPAILVAELANFDWGEERVFGISAKSGRLYQWLNEIADAAEVEILDRVAFHAFRHTWAAWMRRYGGLDTSGLVATGAWRSRAGAAVYEHVETSEEARKAEHLPLPGAVPKSGRRPAEGEK